MTSNTNAPLWLLGVNGVLISESPGWGKKRGQHPNDFSHTRSLTLPGSEIIRWSAHAVKTLGELHTSGAVELVWCTTRAPIVDILEDAWGWPELGAALTVEDVEDATDEEIREAKLCVALDAVNDGCALVWTDAYAIPQIGRSQPEREIRLTLLEAGAMLVTPAHPAKGLHAKNFERIQGWMKWIQETDEAAAA